MRLISRSVLIVTAMSVFSQNSCDGGKYIIHIHCTVKDCKYHKGDENYCSLDTINVATHESNPTDVKCVDCRSFECKRHGIFG